MRLSYLEGIHPKALQLGLSERCTKQTLEGYLEQLGTTTAPLSVVSSVHGLTMMLRVLAPDRDWKSLERVRNDLQLRARPSRDKRSKLRASDEILVVTIKALQKLKRQLPTKATLTEYRNLIMLAVIAPCPIRRRNFADLSIGNDFIRLERGWTILLPPGKVKNGEQASLEVPGFLTEFIDHYVDNVRSTFPRSTGSSRLWLTWYGTPMSGHSVYLRMIEVTEKHFGEALNPHIFRDCAATSLSWEDPAAARAAQGLLGHRSDRPTQKHYIHARQIEAARRVNALLESLTRRAK